MTLSAPTSTSLKWLRKHAEVNKELRRFLRGVKAKDRRAARVRAATIPLTERQQLRFALEQMAAVEAVAGALKVGAE